jgi:hypothetical protein
VKVIIVQFWGNFGSCNIFEQVSIPPRIHQECQEFLGDFGSLTLFEQVSISPGFLQESIRNARNSWVNLGLSIFFQQVSIPPGIHQESSRKRRGSVKFSTPPCSSLLAQST